MDIFLVLVVIFGIAVFLMRKRNAQKTSSGGSRPTEQIKPLTVAPKPASKRADTASKQVETPVVEVAEKSVASKPAEIESQPEKAITLKSSLSFSNQPEQIPEDSTLRRHYLSTRQAEKEAIHHPYPTDSVLKRHYESMQVTSLKQAPVAVNAQNPGQPVSSKCSLPEDSTLRRHVLTQMRAEIEAQLSPRPTDSTLRRHYDSQVEAKMEAYLAKGIA